MKSVLRQAAELLENGICFTYAVVISQRGSTPRSTGTKMLVLPDRIIGTIGGGAMEASVIGSAREISGPVIQTHELTETAGFLCGGTTEVLLAPISPENPSNLEVFKAAAGAVLNGERAWLIYAIDSSGGAQRPFQICLSRLGKDLVGDFAGSEKVRRDMLDSPLRLSIHGDDADGVRYIADRLHSGGVIYLFGAGHVSQDVAKLAANLEFKVTVIDDRADYCNNERFPDCECLVIDSFQNLPDFDIDDNSYILIITRGHAHDRTVLEWSIEKNPIYLGMIGSRSKRDKTYSDMISKGVDKKRLDRVKCPVGLDIGAETTAEIAVSIMAQIIAARRGKEDGQDGTSC